MSHIPVLQKEAILALAIKPDDSVVDATVNGGGHAEAVCKKLGKKGILIGKQGARLKKIGSQARTDIESFVGNKVMLKLWVRVKTGWSDNDRALLSLGYESP